MSDPKSIESETPAAVAGAAPCSADGDLADKLMRVLMAEMQYKADCFDYLCWLAETEQSENVKGADFLVMASDGTTCWGKNYADCVKVAMKHDKELYDAVRDLEANPPDEPTTRCVRFGCKDAPLTYLKTGQSKQTENGFLIAKLDGWYCPECAGSYGNFNPPNSKLRDGAPETPPLK